MVCVQLCTQARSRAIDHPLQFPTGKISHKRWVKDGLCYSRCLPPPVAVRPRLTDSRGVSHLSTLQVQQDIVYPKSCLCHMYICRTGSSDPKVRTSPDNFPTRPPVTGNRVLIGPNRIYAVTGKSRPIAVAFAVIATSQLALGIYMTFMAATHAGGPWTQRIARIPPLAHKSIVAGTIPPIPFDSFKICVFSRRRKTEIAYTVILLVYGEAF